MEGGATARRALRLLEALAASGPAPALEDLSQSVGLSRSTAYRLLRVLEDEAYVERAPTGGYRLGSRLVGLAAAALPQLDLYAAARPVLRRLARLSGETVTLHRRAGDLAVLVLAEESEEHSLRRVATIGEAAPLYRGCVGLSILATLGETERESLITRSSSPLDQPALRARLEEVRRRGVARSQSENHPGVNGVAVAVSATGGLPTATSVAVSGPAQRWTPARIDTVIAPLLEAEHELSRLFALQPHPTAPSDTSPGAT